jgi:uncharacterized protein YoxC
MASEVTRGEHTQLVARVDVLEREVEGEKMVTRHILEQTRRNSDDLAVIKTRLERVEAKVDDLTGTVGGLTQTVGGLTQTVGGFTQDVRRFDTSLKNLVRDLPQIVGDAVREAMPKRRSRR